MSESNFFEQQTNSSRVKARIVSDYFPQYCRIIRKKHEPQAFRYIDLFSGPGVYDDGNESTPLLLARNVAEDPTLKDKVQFIFNDLYHVDKLRENFENEFPRGTFPKGVYFLNKEVGKDAGVYNFLQKNTMEIGVDGKYRNEAPSLLFFDPFGYKGMKTDVLASFLRNWGNEIFLFINTKRINPALENEKFEDLVKLWFPNNFESLKSSIRRLRSVPERLEYILTSLHEEFESLLGKGAVHSTAFRFQEEDIRTTSHYILHLTKGSRGYELVKNVYNKYANEDIVLNGSNTYTFDPKKCEGDQTLFGNVSESVEALKDILRNEYQGKELSTVELYNEHQEKTKYCYNHYLMAIRSLVKDGVVSARFTDGKKHTVAALISPYCILSFK